MGSTGPTRACAKERRSVPVPDDGSDFFGGALRFVGAVLNALFRVDTSSNPSMRVWTDDSVVTEMPLTPMSAVEVTTLGGAQPSMQQRAHDEIAALQHIDPDFNELQFLSQATSIYQTYLSADGGMNPDALAGVATPGMIAWYRQRAAQWKAAGERRVVRDPKLLGSAVMKVSIDADTQAIIVRFSWSGVRFMQDADSGIATEGSMQSDSFTEFATFVRPPGTTTPKAAATGGETHCPSCGAPTTAGAAKCPFCGTQLTGTGSVWLLDKISASPYT
jgi:inner membrane protein import complex subunit Tim44-like protein